MTFKAKIICDICSEEKELDSEYVYDVDLEVEKIAEEGKWLFDNENDTHYCPKCAPMAAEEQGIEYNYE